MAHTFHGRPCKNCGQTLRYKGSCCVACTKAKSKERWANGTKKQSVYEATYRRNRNLVNNYGLTIADYDRLAYDQDWGCAICHGPPGGSAGRFHVDHNHATGAIRALLCHTCNVGLGSFQDDPLRLELAAEYLRKHAARL